MSARSADEKSSVASAVRQPQLLTVRGFAIAFAIGIFAVAMAVGSIWVRRTPMEKTTQFFGSEIIKAIQSGENLIIVLPAGSPLIDEQFAEMIAEPDGSQEANLSGSPGLGHFRHALLNQKHYDWTSQVEENVESLAISDPEYIYVRIEGRDANAKPVPMPIEIAPTKLVLELTEGWVGIAGQSGAVRLTERVRTAMRNFIETRKDIGAYPI